MYLSFKKKQQTEYTLAVVVVRSALGELANCHTVRAERRFHLFYGMLFKRFGCADAIGGYPD